MTLRDHLHRWLHPRDPLLEAWKHDPFVEAVTAREMRLGWFSGGLISSILMRRWGCASVLVLSVLVTYIVQLAQTTSFGDEVASTFLGVLVCVVIIRELLVVFRNLYLQSIQSRESFLVILQARGLNPVFLDLWMAGVTGRDLVKAMHVLFCRRNIGMGLWIFGAFLLMPLLAWEPISRAGPIGLVSYVLLGNWFRSVHVYHRYGRLNPLTSVISLFPGTPPLFMAAALMAGGSVVRDDRWSVATLLSGTNTLIAVFIPMMLGATSADEPAVSPGTTLVWQVSYLMVANLIMIAHRLGPGSGFDHQLNSALEVVDRDFDLFVRESILQDPDARRVE